MLVVGIETSCDETGVALLEDGRRILAEKVASQDHIHAPYAGVVPELASRQHLRLLGPLLDNALRDSGCSLDQVSLVAVTRGPGLAGCLLTGLSFAKGLAYGLGLSLIGINHIEAHIYSCFLVGEVEYPALALVVSGGHTLLVLLRGWGRYELLGQTLDDAVGEAYDKVASMLGLPFPGGPAMEARARGGSDAPDRGVLFPRPLLQSGDFNFSFSGLKTAVLYWLKKREGKALGASGVNRVAFAFQEAVIEVLAAKSFAAARRFKVRCILLAGGVARNEALRNEFRERAAIAGVRIICPGKSHCSDNAVMVAALGSRKYAEGARGDWALDIEPGLKLCK